MSQNIFLHEHMYYHPVLYNSGRFNSIQGIFAELLTACPNYPIKKMIQKSKFQNLCYLLCGHLGLATIFAVYFLLVIHFAVIPDLH